MPAGSGNGKWNPRRRNGSLRSKQRRMWKSLGLPCGICHGARGPIRYDQPSDHLHPLSFVIDEIKPVSQWRRFGYPSAAAAALDPANQRPAHWICNAQCGDKIDFELPFVGDSEPDEFPNSGTWEGE